MVAMAAIMVVIRAAIAIAIMVALIITIFFIDFILTMDKRFLWIKILKDCPYIYYLLLAKKTDPSSPKWTKYPKSLSYFFP